MHLPQPVAAPNYPVDCTTSVAAPVLDTLCASYFVINGIALASGSGNFTSDSRAGGVALSAGLALFCAVSAGNGYSSAKRCEQVKNLNALCITGDLPSCTRLRPDWRPPENARWSPAERAAGPAADGCSMDKDCKGDRICERGACVDPRRPVPAPVEPPGVRVKVPEVRPAQCQRDADCDRGVCSDGVCRQ